ncbi:MAG: hypothetical protein GXO23_04055 [Crenarchaeota archaeon]|nr:hypothetical protein [Thermoproteota archaeon]
MLLSAFKIDEEAIERVCEIVRRDVAESEDKLMNVLVTLSNEARLIRSITEIFNKDTVIEIIKRRGVRELVEELLKIFNIINKISDIESTGTTLSEILEKSRKITEKELEAIRESSRRLSETLITSRSCLKIFEEAGRVGLRDRISQAFVYVINNVLKGTEFELGAIEKVPPHIDIHVIKVFLRTGILVPVRDVLNRYVGESRYVLKILPVCAKLAPDEPFKTVWDVLRRRSLEVFNIMKDRLNTSQILLSIYISVIGRKFCLFSDDSRSRDSACPIKGLVLCPLSRACSSYLADRGVQVFSRRQMRLVLRLFNAPRSVVDNACESILI